MAVDLALALPSSCAVLARLSPWLSCPPARISGRRHPFSSSACARRPCHFSYNDTALPTSPCRPGAGCLLPSSAKTVPHADPAGPDPRSAQSLRPPQFAPVRPFLRWGLQSLPASALRPKLPSSMQLGGPAYSCLWLAAAACAAHTPQPCVAASC